MRDLDEGDIEKFFIKMLLMRISEIYDIRDSLEKGNRYEKFR